MHRRVSQSCDDSKQIGCQLSQAGLRLKEIRGDGNCLFRAIVDQLHGSDAAHRDLRRQTVEHILHCKDYFGPFIEDGTLDRHAERMGRDGVHGGNMELVACAQALNIEIVIHQVSTLPFIVSGSTPQRTIHIVYHSWEHYSSTRPAHDASSTPRLMVAASNKNAHSRQAAKINTVMKVTGMHDLDRIRALLLKHNDDVDDTINAIWEERNGPGINLEDLSQVEETVIENIATDETNVQPLSTKQGTIKPPQKLSAREKRDEQRKKKKERKVNKINSKKQVTNSPSQQVVVKAIEGIRI